MASAAPTMAPPQLAGPNGSLDRNIRTRKLLLTAGCLAGGRGASPHHALLHIALRGLSCAHT